MPKHYYELIDDKSPKFWEIEQKGSALHLRWGKIGTYGQSKVKKLDSSNDAKNEAEKSIRQKTKKGYAKADPFDEKINDKLRKFLDLDNVARQSVQFALHLKFDRIMHEEHGNGSGNWDSDKCELNEKGYSVEYLINLVQKYLDDNPDGFMARLQLRVDSERIIFDRADIKYKKTIFKDYGNGKRNKEYYKIEFINELSKCASAKDIYSLTNSFKLNEIWKTLDFSKCTTTQEQLDTSSPWDEDLNWLIGWLTDHALLAWNDEYIDKLRNSLELLRPKVPIGVVNSESNDEWHRQNNKERFTDARAYDNAQEFIEKSIFSWIYQNPDLIDLKGKSLGKSVKEIFR